MSEITREQIERALQTKIEDDRVWLGGPVAVRLTDLLALALKGLDHAADARLGAAFRSELTLAPSGAYPGEIRDAVTFLDPNEVSIDEPVRGYEVARALSKVADALEAEQADAARGEGR